MTAGAVTFSYRLMWRQFIDLAKRLGAEIDTATGLMYGAAEGEVVVYTGRNELGAWIV